MRKSIEQHAHESGTDLTTAAAFFAKHAGTSWHPDHETAEQGAARSGMRLAMAEHYAKGNGWTVNWEDDWEISSHVEEYPDAYVAEPDDCEQATLEDEDGEILASLGCIDDASDDYRRVIEAELALQAARTLHDATKPEHYYDPKRADITTDPHVVTCGACDLMWCDVCDPTPAGRCHNELEHDDDDEDDDVTDAEGFEGVMTFTVRVPIESHDFDVFEAALSNAASAAVAGWDARNFGTLTTSARFDEATR